MPFWSLTKHLRSKPTAPPASTPATPTSTMTPTNHHTPAPLHTQHATRAPAADKIRLSILATAIVDALGGPAEFQARFSFPLVSSMVPNDNFALPPGVWTDDTSMTLCLARSLATYTPKTKTRYSHTHPGPAGGFDEKHQLDAYVRWHRDGVLSAIDRCFDIGNTIQRALGIYAAHVRSAADAALREVHAKLSAEDCAGNGSLMRVLPVGLAYWRDEAAARAYAGRSSRTTHPNGMCVEACEMWTGMVVRVMQNSGLERTGSLTKLDLVRYVAGFPYTNGTLRGALGLASDVPPPPRTLPELEAYYFTHHPILRLVTKMQSSVPTNSGGFSKHIPSAKDLPSSGYVLHTMAAALYCFFATRTFEEGAIMAVNLGGDADTVGAVYAGLAGCWYAGEEGRDTTGVFWTERVKTWRGSLVKRDLVEKVANELVRFSATLATGTNDH